jgi:hypothetical protein
METNFTQGGSVFYDGSTDYLRSSTFGVELRLPFFSFSGLAGLREFQVLAYMILLPFIVMFTRAIILKISAASRF